MSNEIEIVVTGQNRSKPALKEPTKDLEELRAEAKKTGPDLDAINGIFDRLAEHADRLRQKEDGLGQSQEKTRQGSEKLSAAAKALDDTLVKLMADFRTAAPQTDMWGEKLAGTGGMAHFLEQRLATLRGEAKQLGQEFDRTGNIDIFKKLRDNQNTSTSLQKIKADLVGSLTTGAVDAGKLAGTEFAKNFSAEAQGIESNPLFGSALAVAIITGIVATAPLIGAALNAALISGVGLGGVGLGIIGQISDPAVHDAFTGLLYDVTTEWQQSTTAFAEPLLGAAAIFKGAFEKILPDLESGIGKLALYVEPLAAGIQGLFVNMMPGFTKALDAAGPILMAIAQELPLLGKALSDMFASISGGSHGAEEALRTVFLLLDGGIRIVGWLIEGFSKLYEAVVVVIDKIASIGDKLLGWIPGIGAMAHVIHTVWDEVRGGPDTSGMTYFSKVIGDTTIDFKGLASQIGQTAETADTLAAKMSQKMFNSLMSVDEGTLHWHESLTQLSDTLSKNGLAIDRHTHLIAMNTANGEANRQAILGAVSANMAQYQAFIAAGMSAQDATNAYNENTSALEKQLRQAGYTKAQIDDLIGKYRDVPKNIDTDIAMHGLTDAINDLDDAIRLANGLDGRVVKLTIQEQYRTSGADAYGYTGHASGGIWGGMTWVGEHGRELVRLPQGSQVLSHGDSQRAADAMATQSAGSGDSGRTVTFAGDTDRAFARLFAELVRDRLIVIS